MTEGVKDWFGLVARLVTGGVWIVAGALKLETTVRDQLDAAVEAGEVNVEYRPLNFLSGFGDYSAEATNAFAVVLDTSGPDVAKAGVNSTPSVFVDGEKIESDKLTIADIAQAMVG